MKFRTPCFVRVEDAKKRRRLLIWLQEIGYDLYQSARSLNYPILCCNMIDDEPGNVYGEYAEELTGLCGIFAYDCGDNIELFKALAAMTDDRNDVNQWYVFAADYYFGEEDVYYHRGHVISGIDMIYVFEDWRNALYYCRKATADEIVEHFKKYRDSRKISKN